MPASLVSEATDARGTARGRSPGKSSVLRAPSGEKILHQYYDALYRAHGAQAWWPGRTRFEVIVGAILTQNTSWKNVERAIGQLRGKKMLTVQAIEQVDVDELAQLIRSSGYYRMKAKKLKAFVEFLRREFKGSLTKMFAAETSELRQMLLGVHGIGPETADSILLYAGGHRVFVVDAYTRRILFRHGLAQGDETYEEVRGLFERSLPASAAVFNEYHALIVKTGKDHCRASEARCAGCALQQFLPEAGKAEG